MRSSSHSLSPAARHRRLCNVTPTLTVSGDLPIDPVDAVHRLGEWQAAGITHVLDCRGEWSDEALVTNHAPTMSYRWVGTNDYGLGQPDEFWVAGVAFAHIAAQDPEARLLVHCHMGMNRDPSMAFRILLDRGWDRTEALGVIRSARPIAAIVYADSAFDHHAVPTTMLEDRRLAGRRHIAAWHDRNPLDLFFFFSRVRDEPNPGRRANPVRPPSHHYPMTRKRNEPGVGT